MSTINKATDSSANKKDEKQTNHCIDFHGAAIIDRDGNETAITEEMIEKACQELKDDHFLTPYMKQSPKNN